MPHAPHYSDDAVTLYAGDCLDVLRQLPDCSVHAVVCDPPYGLSDVKPDAVVAALTAWANGDRERVPGARGFMGRSWDAFVPPPAVWDECLRVLTPGGHLLAFAGSRTADLMGLSIRMAGFEIRDTIVWLYGSGFPKSLDVSKAIDKVRDDRAEIHAVGDYLRARLPTRPDWAAIDAACGCPNTRQKFFSRSTPGMAARCPTWEQWERLRELLGFGDEVDAEVWRLNGRKGTPGEAWGQREVIGTNPNIERARRSGGDIAFGKGSLNADITAPATPAAEQWQGWGTALKPAQEPIIVARKPLAGTVAATVLAHGTGALNVDATRVSPSSPERVGPSFAQRSPLGSPLGTGADALAPPPGSAPCTCAEPPACSSDDTSPGRGSGTPLHSLNTAALGPVAAGPEGRSALPASAPAGEPGCPPPSGSPDGCQSSPHSGDGRALSEAEGAPTSPRPRGGADERLAPRATPGRNPADRSTACPKCTAGHVDSPGRWPANVVLSHVPSECGGDACESGCVPGCPVAELDAQSEGTRAAKPSERIEKSAAPTPNAKTWEGGPLNGSRPARGYTDDQGGASRFFPTFRYQAKAPARERPKVDGVAHVSVKPLALMRWLVRLVTPPGGTVLEPFAGSGTTLEAAMLEGFHVIAVERQPEYLPLIMQRIERAHTALAERAAAEAKAAEPTTGTLFDVA